MALNPISWIPLHLLNENSNTLAIPEEVIGDLVEGVWFVVAIALSLAIILQIRLYLKRNRWNESMKT